MTLCYVYKETWIVLLYYIDGVVIAAQCTATFSRSIVLPRIRVLGSEYADYIFLRGLFFQARGSLTSLKSWLGTPSLKSLQEDLCSGFLRLEKIHQPQPDLNLRTFDLKARLPRPTWRNLDFTVWDIKNLWKRDSSRYKLWWKDNNKKVIEKNWVNSE